jgi:hypothetical protein
MFKSERYFFYTYKFISLHFTPLNKGAGGVRLAGEVEMDDITREVGHSLSTQ